ncbi:hypothetical protein ACRVGM_002041 [Cronobacter sakazakii]
MSKERVEALASSILECHDVKPSEVKALAALALMALRERAEPVGWTDEQELRDAKKSGVGYLFGMGAEANKFADPHRKMMLHTAPPAPVVPAETFEEWSRLCEIQITLCRPEFREVAEITWNACRAAMLAAPGKN